MLAMYDSPEELQQFVDMGMCLWFSRACLTVHCHQLARVRVRLQRASPLPCSFFCFALKLCKVVVPPADSPGTPTSNSRRRSRGPTPKTPPVDCPLCPADNRMVVSTSYLPQHRLNYHPHQQYPNYIRLLISSYKRGVTKRAQAATARLSGTLCCV